jgi:hypothetical protein
MSSHEPILTIYCTIYLLLLWGEYVEEGPSDIMSRFANLSSLLVLGFCIYDYVLYTSFCKMF